MADAHLKPEMTDQRAVAAALATHGRGLVTLDQPPVEIARTLCRAGVSGDAVRQRELRELVLSVPGLDRVVNGVVLDPATLLANRPPVASLARRGCLIGVGMDLRPGPEGSAPEGRTVPVSLAEEIRSFAACGATFARWSLLLDGATGQRPTATRGLADAVADRVLACQHGGLVPFVDCAVAVPDRVGLAGAERAQTAALAELVAALDRAGVDPRGLLLGVGVVLPGAGALDVDDSTDVARATLRSLRSAGVGKVSGVVLRSRGRTRHLTAHLLWMQWMEPEWPLTFALGRSVLEHAARAWRGRPERAAAAQQELRGRFATAARLLHAGLHEVRRRGGQAWLD